jgi:hypothetical protein
MKLQSLKAALFILIIQFNSCTKTTTVTTNSRTGSPTTTTVIDCSKFKNLKIQPYKVDTCGKDIIIKVDSFAWAYYNWTGPNNFYINNLQNSYEIRITDNSNLYHRGWYKVVISRDTCPRIYDSIYIDVKLPQGTPSCSPTKNTSNSVSGITIPNKTFTNVTTGNYYGYEIEGTSSIGDISLIFHNHWATNKLEPGIYYTFQNYSSMNDKENINKVCIRNTYGNDYWYSEAKRPVYVSYVNGKISVTFCNIKTINDDNNTYTSTINGNLTLP